MRYLAPFLLYAFVALTNPTGAPLWIQHDALVAVLPARASECHAAAKTQVITSSGTFCVTELPQEVMDAFKGATDAETE